MRRLLEALGLAGILAVWAVLARRFWFITDDAFISFRYARNWAEGLGLRYNLGEQLPVEGYSNFLWVAALRFVHQAGADMVEWAPVLSMACGAILIVLFHLRLRDRVDAVSGLMATAGVAVAAPFVLWSTGGLATVPFTLFWFLTLDQCVLRKEGMAPLRAGLAALLLSLIRTEGIAWAVLLGLFGLLRPSSGPGRWRRGLGFGAVLGVGYGLYFLWRLDHFEALLPNTAQAKVDPSPEVFERGLHYVMTYVMTVLTPLALIPLSLLALIKPRDPSERPVALLAWAVFAYAVVVGGDFMSMGRFLVPSVPLVAWLVAQFLARGGPGGFVKPVWRLAAGGALALLGALPLENHLLVPREQLERWDFRLNTGQVRTEIEHWEMMRTYTVRRTELGKALAEFTEEGEDLVCGAIGCVGYYSGLTIHDRYGLVDAEVAKAGGRGKLKSPGHDMAVRPEFFLPREPKYLGARVVIGDDIARDAHRVIEKWDRKGLRDSYVPVVHLVPRELVQEDERDGAAHILVLFRRITDGIEPEVAWRRFERRLSFLANASNYVGAVTEEEGELGDPVLAEQRRRRLEVQRAALGGSSPLPPQRFRDTVEQRLAGAEGSRWLQGADEDWYPLSSVRSFLDANPEDGAAAREEVGDPRSVIVHFARQLHENDVEALFVAVPSKLQVAADTFFGEPLAEGFAGHAPALRRLLRELNEDGVEVVDLLPVFAEERDADPARRLFHLTRFSWTPRAAERAARAVAAAVEPLPGLAPASLREGEDFEIVEERTLFEGRRRAPEGHESEELWCRRVVDLEGEPFSIERPSAKVVVVGDALVGVHQDLGSSFAAHLAAQLRRPVDSISIGRDPIRLSRDLLRKRYQDLAEKTVVIWLLSADRLSPGRQWVTLDLFR